MPGELDLAEISRLQKIALGHMQILELSLLAAQASNTSSLESLVGVLENAINAFIVASKNPSSKTTESKEAVETKELSKPLEKDEDNLTPLYLGLVQATEKILKGYMVSPFRFLTPRISTIFVKLHLNVPNLGLFWLDLARCHLQHVYVLLNVKPQDQQEIETHFEKFKTICDSLLAQKLPPNEVARTTLIAEIYYFIINFQHISPKIIIPLCEIGLKFVPQTDFLAQAIFENFQLTHNLNNNISIDKSLAKLSEIAEAAITAKQVSNELYVVFSMTRTSLQCFAIDITALNKVMERLQSNIPSPQAAECKTVVLPEILGGKRKRTAQESAGAAGDQAESAAKRPTVAFNLR